jgi:hypothetical protein
LVVLLLLLHHVLLHHAVVVAHPRLHRVRRRVGHLLLLLQLEVGQRHAQVLLVVVVLGRGRQAQLRHVLKAFAVRLGPRRGRQVRAYSKVLRVEFRGRGRGPELRRIYSGRGGRHGRGKQAVLILVLVHRRQARVEHRRADPIRTQKRAGFLRGLAGGDE